MAQVDQRKEQEERAALERQQSEDRLKQTAELHKKEYTEKLAQEVGYGDCWFFCLCCHEFRYRGCAPAWLGWAERVFHTRPGHFMDPSLCLPRLTMCVPLH
jgi:hypothetical protein